jgi:hypothetical protein
VATPAHRSVQRFAQCLQFCLTLFNQA